MWYGTAGAATVVAVVVLGASQLLPMDRTAPGVGTGATLVVAADGSGDYGTIATAVAAAHDGDTILVRPGRYVESVFVDGKDLTIAGDGEQGTVIVVAATSPGPGSPADAPSSDAYPWAFALADGDIALSDLTIESAGDAIDAWGDGSPVLVGLDVRAPEGSLEGPGVWLRVRPAASSETVAWSARSGIGAGSRISIVGNELPATCIGMWDRDSQATIRDNTIRGCEREFGIHIGQGSTATIEGNDIEVPDLPADLEAMYLEGLSGILLVDSGDGVVIRDNAIHGSATGIMATASAGFGPHRIQPGDRQHDRDRASRATSPSCSATP